MDSHVGHRADSGIKYFRCSLNAVPHRGHLKCAKKFIWCTGGGGGGGGCGGAGIIVQLVDLDLVDTCGYCECGLLLSSSPNE